MRFFRVSFVADGIFSETTFSSEKYPNHAGLIKSIQELYGCEIVIIIVVDELSKEDYNNYIGESDV